jgi:arsenate reductase
MAPLRILFLCTANSCRSQMAEGWTRALHPDRITACSAGTKPSAVHPLTRQVMQEAGVDISGQQAKSLDQFLSEPFDWVITLCGEANESCPVFPGAVARVHVGFDDPTRASGSPEDVLAEFRRVRDEIRAFVAGLPESIGPHLAQDEGTWRLT